MLKLSEVLQQLQCNCSLVCRGPDSVSQGLLFASSVCVNNNCSFFVISCVDDTKVLLWPYAQTAAFFSFFLFYFFKCGLIVHFTSSWYFISWNCLSLYLTLVPASNIVFLLIFLLFFIYSHFSTICLFTRLCLMWIRQKVWLWLKYGKDWILRTSRHVPAQISRWVP